MEMTCNQEYLRKVGILHSRIKCSPWHLANKINRNQILSPRSLTLLPRLLLIFFGDICILIMERGFFLDCLFPTRGRLGISIIRFRDNILLGDSLGTRSQGGKSFFFCRRDDSERSFSSSLQKVAPKFFITEGDRVGGSTLHPRQFFLKHWRSLKPLF